MGEPSCSPSSEARPERLMASLAASEPATISASQDDSATVACFFEAQETGTYTVEVLEWSDWDPDSDGATGGSSYEYELWGIGFLSYDTEPNDTQEEADAIYDDKKMNMGYYGSFFSGYVPDSTADYVTEFYGDTSSTGPTTAGGRVLRIRYGDDEDCDGNGLRDSCELATGAADYDGNGVLDVCMSKDQREIMVDLLENIQTSKLQSAFDKYIPAVIDGKTPAKKKATLTESEAKEITGNKESNVSRVSQEENNNIIHIQKLAGLNWG